jgi:hypothetical protein
MTVSQTNTGTAGPLLGMVSGVTSTPNLMSSTYSMACRVRWSISGTATNMVLCSMQVAANARGFYFQRKSGDAATIVEVYRFNGTSTFNVANATGAYGSTTAWVHIGATYDGTTIRTYVNGVASGTVASAASLLATGVADKITLCGPFSGDICDVVMYRRALSAQEMNEIAISRLPINRRTDLSGWWPMTDPTSLTLAGIDYSTIGNHCTLQASGANNPSATHLGVPVPYFASSNRLILPQGVVNVATAAGLTNTTGSAAAGESISQTAAGLTNTTGAAAAGESIAQTAAGLTNTTGTAATVLVYPSIAAGLTQTKGDATNIEVFPSIAAGLTQTTGAASGAATGAFAATAAGLTQTTGAAAASELVSLTAAGSTQTTGAANTVLVYPSIAAGLTQTKGDAAVSGYSTIAAGLTNVTGDATASSSAGPTGPALGNRQDTADRRWLGGIGARRNLRR